LVYFGIWSLKMEATGYQKVGLAFSGLYGVTSHRSTLVLSEGLCSTVIDAKLVC
jgi:hypothetical protein